MHSVYHLLVNYLSIDHGCLKLIDFDLSYLFYSEAVKNKKISGKCQKGGRWVWQDAPKKLYIQGESKYW